MLAEVERTAGPDDNALSHNRDCDCRTCLRRAALRGPNLVPRVDGVTGQVFANPTRKPRHIDDILAHRDEPDTPPRHRESGQFLAAKHPIHDGRNVNGEFIDEEDYAA